MLQWLSKPMKNRSKICVRCKVKLFCCTPMQIWFFLMYKNLKIYSNNLTLLNKSNLFQSSNIISKVCSRVTTAVVEIIQGSRWFRFWNWFVQFDLKRPKNIIKNRNVIQISKVDNIILSDLNKLYLKATYLFSVSSWSIRFQSLLTNASCSCSKVFSSSTFSLRNVSKLKKDQICWI